VKRKMILTTTLLVLTACSTNHRLLAPDQEARQVSSRKPSHPANRGVDPVCGAPMEDVQVYWHSTYEGSDYYFDSGRCKLLFDESPERYSTLVR
jgi:YHS domain-containing protein